VPAGLSSKILLARPDIRQAYWQMIASGYAEKKSLANYFPNLTLTGNYGFSTSELDHFLSSKSLAGSLGLGLFQPLLNYGAIDGEYQRSKIQCESAWLAYNDCIRKAFQEVNEVLITYKSDYEAFQSHKRQLLSSLELYSIAKAKDEAGLLDGVSYLNYQMNLLQLEYQGMGQRVLLLEDVVQLYKVLGLGFNKKNGNLALKN
jgi:multidrug efflux system outer membrane protein